MIPKSGNRLLATIMPSAPINDEPEAARLDQTPESVNMSMEACLAD
jgi:hypothetical protein